VYRNLETACRPMKTDLKVGFQPAIGNATDARHAMQIKKTQRMQCMHTKNAVNASIESVVCVAFFACVRCIFRGFDSQL